jgi:hypothetical protein
MSQLERKGWNVRVGLSVVQCSYKHQLEVTSCENRGELYTHSWPRSCNWIVRGWVLPNVFLGIALESFGSYFFVGHIGSLSEVFGVVCL